MLIKIGKILINWGYEKCLRGRKERSTCKEILKEIFRFEVNIEWYGVYFKPNQAREK